MQAYMLTTADRTKDVNVCYVLVPNVKTELSCIQRVDSCTQRNTGLGHLPQEEINSMATRELVSACISLLAPAQEADIARLCMDR